MIRWGRPEKINNALPLRRFLMVVLIGGTMVGSVFILNSNSRNEYITVSNTTETNDGDQVISSEPYGYFSGKWNLWEYIGDFVSTLITDI